MNDQPSPEISSDFKEVYPYLAADYARQDEYDTTLDLTYEDAMKILFESGIPKFKKEENEEKIKYTRHRTARDSFIDWL